MKPITGEKVCAVPEQMEIVYKVHMMIRAEGGKPTMEVEDSTKAARSATQRGEWTRHINRFPTAADHINQLLELAFQDLRLFEGCVVRSHMDNNFIDRWWERGNYFWNSIDDALDR